MKIITVNIRSVIIGLTAICTTLCIALLLISSNIFGAQNKSILPVYRVKLEEGDKRIAITFDNAWGADDIPSILNTLKEYNAVATFFVLGTWTEKYPEVVKSIYDAGHEIANHSYAHRMPTKLSEKAMLEEIQKCNDAIQKVTGQGCNIYRAPSGDYNDFVMKTAKKAGMYTIQWDVDSLDWKDEMSQDAIYQRVTSRVKPGSIILFHNDTKHTQNVLPKILQKLSADGYQSVKISDLIYQDNYTIDHTGEQQKKLS